MINYTESYGRRVSAVSPNRYRALSEGREIEMNFTYRGETFKNLSGLFIRVLSRNPAMGSSITVWGLFSNKNKLDISTGYIVIDEYAKTGSFPKILSVPIR